MSEIDWDKAPADATHAFPLHGMPFRKKVDRLWYTWNGDAWTINHGSAPSLYVERPWSGTGAPPVGTVCEMFDPNNGIWGKVEVVFVSDLTVVVRINQREGNAEWARDVREAEFRPIRAEREEAIDEMTRIISSKIADRRAAESLYELGYRKVQP